MSIWPNVVDLASTIAASEAASLPVTGAGTLQSQVRIFGFGATALGEEADAIAHQESVVVVLTAVGIGIAVVALLPEAAAAGAVAAVVEASLPLLGGVISEGALTAIVAGVVEVGIGGFVEAEGTWAINSLLGAFEDYAWAVGNPGAVIGELPPAVRNVLPDWIDGPAPLWEQAPGLISPLVVDLDGGGIELTTFNAATTTTFFDLNSDGFAEQTAWVSNDDGLLARDINENGKIDDATELFGSPTIDGFAKLALLDSNGDLTINQYDDAWAELVIWQDINGDAVTQNGELLTLSSLDIVSIDLAGVAASTSTISGNAISHISTFRYENGSTDDIVDAWFVHDKANTYYIGDYTLDPSALFLPTLRGFGTLPDLDIAMSGDATLLGLVEDLAVAGWDFETFQDAATLDDDITEILYRWAGVDDVDPSSRGSNMDAQHLGFLEAFFGEDFVRVDPGRFYIPESSPVINWSLPGTLYSGISKRSCSCKSARVRFSRTPRPIAFSPARSPATWIFRRTLSTIWRQLRPKEAWIPKRSGMLSRS